MPLPQQNHATEPSPSFRDHGLNIARQNLPAFGLTMQEVFRATEHDALSGQQIAEIILRDPALTSSLLRAANTAKIGYFGRNKVATVSRAVVLLGSHAIRSLCISAMAVESMEQASPFRPRVQAALGVALHAAVQARDIGLRKGMRRDEAERLFVQALLGRIGDMAFWCHGGEFAQRMDALLKDGVSPEQAELAVLGMTLRQFSRELLQAWELDAVLTDSPEVAMAESLSRATQQDWDNPEARQAAQHIATTLKQPVAQTQSRLQHNAEQACLLATALGASAVTQWIPTPAADGADAAAEDAPLPPAAEPEPLQPDLSLQLRTLTEMTAVAGSRKELPMLFEACLEGLHRAVGLDRCVLCLMTPSRDRLLARLGAGADVAALRARLQLPWSALLEAELQAGRMRWFTSDQPPPDFLLEATGVRDCFIATLTVDQKIIGLFYADLQPSQRALTEDGFEGFRRFVSQTELIVRGLPR